MDEQAVFRVAEPREPLFLCLVARVRGLRGGPGVGVDGERGARGDREDEAMGK